MTPADAADQPSARPTFPCRLKAFTANWKSTMDSNRAMSVYIRK